MMKQRMTKGDTQDQLMARQMKRRNWVEARMGREFEGGLDQMWGRTGGLIK